MKKEKRESICFKIKFSKTIYLLCIAVFLLCAAGVGISVWRIARFGIGGFSDALKSPFLIAICLFCIVLVISILVKSQYAVDDQNLITQYGFVKSKFAVKDMTSMVLNTETQKLSVYFGEQFTVLSTSQDWNEQLVRAILKINPNIDYSFTLTDTPQKEEKDEK
ncbi:MAG: hypothetical protein IJA89_02350 [Clostridia bacterium]|nr:hypothetical protein [Clostridia bacterium]